MAVVNSVQGGLRLPLAGLAPPRVLMCSASMGAEGSVTLQLREAVQAPVSGSSIDGSLTIGYPDPEMLADMLGSIQAAGTGEVTSFDILDNRENDMTNAVLHKSSTTIQTQTSGSCDTALTNNIISNKNNNNNNSSTNNELSVPAPNQPVVKKARPKTASPTRHGPQQCQVLNKYLLKLGVSEDWSVVDVLGLDPDLLEFVPKPVKALILLFPCSDKYEQHRLAEDEKLKDNVPEYPKDLFYMKQTIHNACGTCALIHAIANNKDIALEDGILKKYLDAARDLSVEERGKLLEGDTDFTDTHQSLALEEPPRNERDGLDQHFIALVQKDGELYELDGRKSFPIKHGPTSDDTFLEDAAKVCKEFMARDPDELRFTIGAIAPTQK